MRPLLAQNRWPFKNGIGRTLIQDLLRKMSRVKAHGFRSVVGHYIAGTAGAEQLSKALDEIE
jgi:hypothetical protein